MSKKLIKIISISLLAIIIPVAVVVIIACLSSAKTYSLTIDTMTTEGKELSGKGTVKFLVNGEEYEEGMKLLKGSKVTIKAQTEGYNFTGWYDCESGHVINGTQKIAGDTRTFTIEGDTNLTAEVKKISYTVVYDKSADNEEIGHRENIKYGESLSTVTEGLAVSNFIDGWYFDADGNGKTDEHEKQSIYTEAIFPVANAEHTVINLISNRKVKTFKVKINDNIKTFNYGDSISVNPGNKKGQHFTGWEYDNKKFTDENGEINFGEYDKDAVYELTPVFEYNYYSVKYNSEEAVTVNYGDKLKDLKTEYSVEDSKYFAGWTIAGKNSIYTTANFTEDIKNGEIISLTSVIKDKEYLISYNGAEATLVKYGNAFADSTETKVGYHFIGWSTEENDVESIVTEANFEENYDGQTTINLYSIWEKNVYEVTFKCGDKEVKQTVEYGENLADKFTSNEMFEGLEEGKCFDCWTYKKDENEIAVKNNEAIFDGYEDGAEILLTAKCRAIVYNVKYGKGDFIEVEYGEKLKVGESDTKTGVVFDHWTYERDEDDVVVENNKAIFDGYEDGAKIILTAQTKNLYEDAYKSVTINYSYKEDGVKTDNTARYTNTIEKNETTGLYELTGFDEIEFAVLKEFDSIKFITKEDGCLIDRTIKIGEMKTIEDIIYAYKDFMKEDANQEVKNNGDLEITISLI